jgi:hypothetical protein
MALKNNYKGKTDKPLSMNKPSKTTDSKKATDQSSKNGKKR